ncbi:pyridoxamine 5'-phosphate oxidase, partial [sediment metagenome]
MASFGDPPGERALVGDTHDEALLTGHQLSSYGHGSFLAGDGSWDKMPVVPGLATPHIVAMIEEKPDPLTIFSAWYEEAGKSEPNDPSAMSLATVGPDGMPAVRMVL